MGSRLGTVALAWVLALVTLAATPLSAAGAAQWAREVRFADEAEGEVRPIWNSGRDLNYEAVGYNLYGAPADSGDCTDAFWLRNVDDTTGQLPSPQNMNSSAWLTATDSSSVSTANWSGLACTSPGSGTANSKTMHAGLSPGYTGGPNSLGTTEPPTDVEALRFVLSVGHLRSAASATTVTFTVRVMFYASGVTQAQCQLPTDLVTGLAKGQTVNIDETIPVDDECRTWGLVVLQSSGTSAAVVWTNAYVEAHYPAGGGGGGGDCSGVAGPGGDGGLVWGSAGLTAVSSHTAWGDIYHAGTANSPSCSFQTTGVFRYVPPEGLSPGETHHFGVELSSATAGQAHVSFGWLVPGGGVVTVLDFTYSGSNPGGAAGPGATLKASNVPNGATGIQIVIYAGSYLHGLYLANVEGDPLLDDGSDGTGDGSGGIGCELPDTPGFFETLVNVSEWVEYIGCAIVSAVNDVWQGVQNVWAAIVGIPGFIANAVGDILEFLFVPTTVGDAWDDFIAALNGHVPFSWIAGASGFLIGGLSGGYLGGANIATSLSILGATVPIDFSGFASDVAWLRPILAGVIYFGCAVAIWRMVGRGLGLGQSE